MVEIKAIIITVSDSRGEKDDISGMELQNCLEDFGAKIIDKLIITDDLEAQVKLFKRSTKRANLIITTGGTGFAPRDNTPEATKSVIEKEAPGLAEMMRFETSKINPKSYLSRGICGISGNCLIINFPGSPKAVKECFDVIKPILQHAVNLVGGDTKH